MKTIKLILLLGLLALSAGCATTGNLGAWPRQTPRFDFEHFDPVT